MISHDKITKKPDFIVQSKEEIITLLEKNHQKLRQFGVNICGLFVSYVKKENHSHTDIDILVSFEPEKKTFDNFMGLAFFLEEIFGRKVDLITLESLNPYISQEILNTVEYVKIRS
jgi:uncharacterized protein